jgi:hypothetical protein
MRTVRLITAALVAVAFAATAAGPSAALASTTSPPEDGARPIPAPPMWPLHPQPVTKPVVSDDARPLPQPPTWPLHPKVIPPPAPSRTVVVARGASFDWASAGIGAAAAFATFAMTLVGVIVLRRHGVARFRF